MTHEDQRRLVSELRGVARTMTRPDFERFEVLDSRDKDDEDFDSLSVKELEDLAAKYLRKKSRAEADEIWKKLTSKPPK